MCTPRAPRPPLRDPGEEKGCQARPWWGQWQAEPRRVASSWLQCRARCPCCCLQEWEVWKPPAAAPLAGALVSWGRRQDEGSLGRSVGGGSGWSGARTAEGEPYRCPAAMPPTHWCRARATPTCGGWGGAGVRPPRRGASRASGRAGVTREEGPGPRCPGPLVLQSMGEIRKQERRDTQGGERGGRAQPPRVSGEAEARRRKARPAQRQRRNGWEAPS